MKSTVVYNPPHQLYTHPYPTFWCVSGKTSAEYSTVPRCMPVHMRQPRTLRTAAGASTDARAWARVPATRTGASRPIQTELDTDLLLLGL